MDGEAQDGNTKTTDESVQYINRYGSKRHGGDPATQTGKVRSLNRYAKSN